jgi:hypothetical protein
VIVVMVEAELVWRGWCDGVITVGEVREDCGGSVQWERGWGVT